MHESYWLCCHIYSKHYCGKYVYNPPDKCMLMQIVQCVIIIPIWLECTQQYLTLQNCSSLNKIFLTKLQFCSFLSYTKNTDLWYRSSSTSVRLCSFKFVTTISYNIDIRPEVSFSIRDIPCMLSRRPTCKFFSAVRKCKAAHWIDKHKLCYRRQNSISQRHSNFTHQTIVLEGKTRC
jgi:hypothetical protein